MSVLARFRPHRRGFGFLNPVETDRLTETTATLTDDKGVAREIDSIFVPPAEAKRFIADDLVEVEATLDDKGASFLSGRLVDRPRRMLVGTVQRGPGRLVLEPDRSLGTGWITLDPSVAGRLGPSIGRQVVVLCTTEDDGSALGRALVAGPHVVGSPASVRAASITVALGRAAPSLVPGGHAAAQLDAAAADTLHTRILGQLASGTRGGAAGLDLEGTIPGEEMAFSDRRDEPAVTIDDARTRDIDDAVGATWDGEASSRVEVAVHIADVAGVVGVGSEADRYARMAASTGYFAVGDNAPMLDPALAEDSLSLLPGVDRRVISVRFAVEQDGALTDVWMEPAAIRSDAKLSYAALESWLEGDRAAIHEETDDPDLTDGVLEAATEAARRLGLSREARMTLESLFNAAEVEPALVNGKLSTRPAEPHADAYRLIERLMVAANECVAAWAVGHDVPALYRAHVGLDPQRAQRLSAAAELAGAKLPDLETAESDEVVEAVLSEAARLEGEGRTEDRDLLVTAATSSMARASYDTDPSHHQGLAAAAYTHFTSPIRRYADLVVHRQIRAAMADEPAPHDAGDLAAIGPWLDARAGAISYAATREREDLWALLLDRGFLDEPEPAVVTAVTPNGLKVRITRLGLTGFVTAERALDLPRGERGSFSVDEHQLSTSSGPWRVGSTVTVRFLRLDEGGRPMWLLGAPG